MGLLLALAAFVLLWYSVILAVALAGFLCVAVVFKKPLPPSHDLDILEPVTIIRPIKGIDPELSLCLESSFLQNYPQEKLQILFCVYEESDPAMPILQLLIAKYPHIDASILVSEPGQDYFGPNPKVNNLTKGFRQAKYDLVWILDLNVWALPNIVANGVSAMMNNTNCGTSINHRGRTVRLVHHVPLAVSLDASGAGSSLDEMFLFTSHSKFYVSLNNLSIAPCVNGKSNMYRRSDLDRAVALIPQQRCEFFHEQSVVSDAARVAARGPGHSISFFAKYIGEDNMIGIALWEYCFGRTALTGDVVLQPLISLTDSIQEYFSRRVRWLRVRKYMVLAATLVEPTTELIVCGCMGTFGLSVLYWDCLFKWKFFIFHMVCWLICDFVQYNIWMRHLDLVVRPPYWFAHMDSKRRSVWQWCRFWVMRELFALPIWITAMVGHEVSWRGRPFRIKQDLSAEEL